MCRTAWFSLSLILLVLAPVARAEPVLVTVARGDTALRIALDHGLTLDELALLNPALDLEHIRAGEPLVVGEGRVVQHPIQSGDTLSAIAQRYGVQVPELVRWNPGVNPNRLLVGTSLHVHARRDEPPSHSVGRVDHGSLENGVQLPESRAWNVRDAERTWVTRDVAQHLRDGFAEVLRRHPNTAPLQIRDASREEGGFLRDHHSHQSGRDIDLVYYQNDCPASGCEHRTTTTQSLDAARMWTLLEAWLRAGVVEYVFIDRALQGPIYREARRSGATTTELQAWFQWPRRRWQRHGAIRHEPQHREHFHVRFRCAPHDEGCIPSDGSPGN